MGTQKLARGTSRVTTHTTSLSTLLRSTLLKRPYLLLLTLLIMVNVIQFGPVNRGAPDNYKALHPKDTPSIIELGAASPTVLGRWSIWIMLGQVSPYSTVIIPSGTLFDRSPTSTSFFSYGKGAEIKTIELDNLGEYGLDFLPFIVASGEGGRDKEPSFAIALSGGDALNLEPSPNIRGVMVSKKLLSSPLSGKEFILIPWEGPEKPFHPRINKVKSESYGLLVDTQLLPESLRSEIDKKLNDD